MAAVSAVTFGLIGASIAVPAASQAAPPFVGTIIELELFKFFQPSGYGNTCQGTDQAAAFKAGSVMSLVFPSGSWTPPQLRGLSVGSAQNQGSELTDRGTCIIRYLGTAQQGLNAFTFVVTDPFGMRSLEYTIIKSDTYPGPTVTPLSRPDMPSVAQSIHVDMF